MKKLICIILTVFVLLSAFSACSKEEAENTEKEKTTEVNEEKTASNEEDKLEDVKKDTVTVWLIDEVAYGSSTVWKYIYDDNYCYIGTEYTYSDGTTERMIYDEYEYDENGNPTHWQYDAVVKYTEKFNEYSDITETVQVFVDYDYETDTSIEQTTIIRYEYEYDDNGRILRKIQYYDGVKSTETTYSYNKDGNILKETEYNNGQPYTTSYTYDSKGRLISESNWYNAINYILDDNGRIIRKDYLNEEGTVYHSETYEYDTEGNYTVRGSGQTQGFDKYGNVIFLAYENSDFDNDLNITYKAVEVTPIRAKAIERHKDMVFYGLYQR